MSDLRLAELRQAYTEEALSPQQVIADIVARAEAAAADNIWILAPEEAKTAPASNAEGSLPSEDLTFGIKVPKSRL